MTAWVGGGSHRGETCLNVVVDGEVVASANGTDIEPLTAVSMDVGRWAGQQARIEIVDAHTGGWGHVNVDRILFSDRPIRQLPVAERPDGGSFALAALNSGAKVRPSIARWATPDDLFDAKDGPAEVPRHRRPGRHRRGAVHPCAGRAKTVRFVFGWYFPIPERELFSELVGASTLRRFYGTRFDSAREVTEHVATHADRLEKDTKAWVKTWYDDSTLPHWFLERTLATASTLATGTCYQWDDGRFYAWEGTYCCAGTCEHVWNYAQAIGRLFPDLERGTRERVDLGIAFKPTGEIGNRGECGDASSSFADGQSGTVLRIYREHQMSPDGEFLQRNWPKIKQATEFLITSRDGATPTASSDGSQWNTLDTEWFGEVPWISGLYVASLRAAAEMATEAGDGAAAARVHDDRRARIGVHLGQPVERRVRLLHPEDRPGAPVGEQQRGLPHRPAVRPDVRRPARPAAGLPGGQGEDGARQDLPAQPARRPAGAPAAGGERRPGLRDRERAGRGDDDLAARRLGDLRRADVLQRGLDRAGAPVRRAPALRGDGRPRAWRSSARSTTGTTGPSATRTTRSRPATTTPAGWRATRPTWRPAATVPRTEGRISASRRRSGRRTSAARSPRPRAGGSYRQRRHGNRLTAEVEVRYGEVRLATLSFQTTKPAKHVAVRLGKRRQAASVVASGNRAVVTLSRPVTVPAGQTLEVELS